MNRVGVINRLIMTFGYENYLEIGCAGDTCFKAIEVRQKTGVDPRRGGTVRLSSDAYFSQNSFTFDLVFVDGLHEAYQVERDIKNSLAILNKNGSLVVHDVNPRTFQMQQVPRVVREWTGDCWRAWVKMRAERPDLSMFVINVDHGVGVIRRGQQRAIHLPPVLTYQALVRHRRHWLNLISKRRFLMWLDQLTNPI